MLPGADIARHLSHRVDLRLVIGTNVHAEDQTAFHERVPCLVDAASGRRRSVGARGVTVSYDFAVTFGPELPIAVGVVLEDARDGEGGEIFGRASVEEVRAYRHPDHGLMGYLGLARSRERDPEDVGGPAGAGQEGAGMGGAGL